MHHSSAMVARVLVVRRGEMVDARNISGLRITGRQYRERDYWSQTGTTGE